MIKLVAVDMDGTFLNGQKEYNKKRFMAIYETMKEILSLLLLVETSIIN
ncbi:hypothetical protein [Vagococcus fluvialis]|nr:hypothetical protein [Vagococcus fluvialis]